MKNLLQRRQHFLDQEKAKEQAALDALTKEAHDLFSDGKWDEKHLCRAQLEDSFVRTGTFRSYYGLCRVDANIEKNVTSKTVADFNKQWNKVGIHLIDRWEAQDQVLWNETRYFYKVKSKYFGYE